MKEKHLPALAATFRKKATTYRRFRTIERMDLQSASRRGSEAVLDCIAALADRHDEILDSRDVAVSAAEALVEGMERGGLDSTLARKWIYGTIGGGGPHCVGTIWADLKVLCQRIESGAVRWQPEVKGPQVKPKAPRRKPLEWTAHAIMLVNEDPRRTDASIAKEVGISPTRLCKSDLYRKAREIARSKSSPPRGFKGSDGSIESADSEYRPDRHTEE